MEPERAAYLREIEARFVALRGRGFMLSPRDVQLVERWRARGIPVRIALGAVEEGVERYRANTPKGTPLPSSLAYFAGHVEDAAARWRELNPGAGSRSGSAPAAAEPTLDPDERRSALMAAIEEAGRAQSDEPPRDVLRRAWRHLKRPATQDLWALASAVDAELVAGLAATLAPGGRAALERRAAEELNRLGGAKMSDEARTERLAAEFERLVRQRFRTPDLVEILVEQQL